MSSSHDTSVGSASARAGKSASSTSKTRSTDLPDLTERLRIRRRTLRGRRLLPVIISLGVLAIALIATIVVRFTPLFTVQNVTVSGNKLISSQQVIDAAAVPLGSPLVSIKSNDIAQRVLSLSPVHSVSVEREWPHTVSIIVTERVAVFQRVSQGSYQWVDGTGTIFHSESSASPTLIQVSTGSVDNRLLSDVATVVGNLPAEVAKLVTKMSANTPDEIVLTLKDGRRVNWGSADQSDIKGPLVKALLDHKATVYDVSSPANPTSR